MSLLRIATQERKEEVEATELRRGWSVYPFLGVCLLLAVALLVAGYDYLRFGHGM